MFFQHGPDAVRPEPIGGMSDEQCLLAVVPLAEILVEIHGADIVQGLGGLVQNPPHFVGRDEFVQPFLQVGEVQFLVKN